jgi:hypothetical protein
VAIGTSNRGNDALAKRFGHKDNVTRNAPRAKEYERWR